MHRLQFHYTLSRDSSPALIRNPLIDLLHAVSSQGSISGGARVMGLSYRHVWGALKRWEGELGNQLLIWEKGQPARLSEFGAKLMWAERQAQVRLTPQIEALRGDLERVFAVAFDPDAHVAMLYASHDEALSLLREQALMGEATARDPAQLHLDIRFCGSLDAIRALNEGRCVMAGFHTLQHSLSGSLAERVYKPLLQPGLHKIIGFAERTQGLMVAPGNPMGLRSLADVQRTQARFVNRSQGTGTRVVLDELLEQAGIASSGIKGYDTSEVSHTAAAHAVATGSADVALGIAIAAQSQGLEFVPLVQEDYHLVCLKSALQEPSIASLLAVLQSASWQNRLSGIAGYRPSQCGQVLSLRRVLGWWSFTRSKSSRTRKVT